MTQYRMASAVYRLPTEVLSAFFVLVKWLASSNHRRSGVARVNAEIKALIELSGVCRRWRQAALYDGTLWADVPLDTARPACGELLWSVLERSKQSMVSVTASVFLSTTDQEKVMEIVPGSSSRIGDLVLDTDSAFF